MLKNKSQFNNIIKKSVVLTRNVLNIFNHSDKTVSHAYKEITQTFELIKNEHNSKHRWLLFIEHSNMNVIPVDNGVVLCSPYERRKNKKNNIKFIHPKITNIQFDNAHQWMDFQNNKGGIFLGNLSYQDLSNHCPKTVNDIIQEINKHAMNDMFCPNLNEEEQKICRWLCHCLSEAELSVFSYTVLEADTTLSTTWKFLNLHSETIRENIEERMQIRLTSDDIKKCVIVADLAKLIDSKYPILPWRH